MLIFISPSVLSPHWHRSLVNVVKIMLLLVLFKQIWHINTAVERCTSVSVFVASLLKSCSPVCIVFLSFCWQVLVITEPFSLSSISVNYWSCWLMLPCFHAFASFVSVQI